MKRSVDSTPDPQDTARAEEVLIDLSEKIGLWASKISFQVLKGVARTREEVEDVWAEAQSLHRANSQPHIDGPAD